MVKNASEYILSHNRTFRKQPPKCQTSLVAYESLDHIGLLEYGNCIDLSHASMPIMQCFTYLKVSFKKKKSGFSHREISVSCTTQESLIIKITLYCPSSGCLRKVKNKRKYQTHSSKKWSRSLRRGDRLYEIPNIVI